MSSTASLKEAKNSKKAAGNNFIRIFEWFDKGLEYFAMCLIVLMTIIISVQVFTRYVFGVTPHWSEEVALLTMVWFGFIGIAIGVKKGIHISIEYFVSLFPKRVQIIIHKIDEVLIFIFGAYLTVFGYQLADATAGSTLPATQWPGYVLYGIIPVSGLMIVGYSIAKFFGKEV